MTHLRRVVLESPFAAPTPEGIAENIQYAKDCMKDSLNRGEAPIASHLLWTQPNLLDDTKPEERKAGIAAGHAWIGKADCVVVYTDRGISSGMFAGIKYAKEIGAKVELRSLKGQAVML